MGAADESVRKRMKRLIEQDEAISVAIAAQAEAVSVGAEPRSLALDAVAALARKLETEARRDRMHLERAARRAGKSPTHIKGTRLQLAIQREQEAEARRLEWLRLRDFARRQQYIEAIRQADEQARGLVGNNPQILHDAWGSGGGIGLQGWNEQIESNWSGQLTHEEDEANAANMDKMGPSEDVEMTQSFSIPAHTSAAMDGKRFSTTSENRASTTNFISPRQPNESEQVRYRQFEHERPGPGAVLARSCNALAYD